MRRLILAAALGLSIVALPVLAAEPTTAAKSARTSKSMSLNGSFHRVHTKQLKLSCEGCHAREMNDVLFLRGSKVAPKAPGPVNREVCRSCHQGESKRVWYGSNP